MNHETERELVSTRLLAAPRERVYRAFSDPESLARWWGPAGFRNEFHEFDLRPGGAWRFVMRGPDGAEYPLEKRFEEVVPGERIVLRQASGVHGFRMTTTLADEAGGTRLTWHFLLDSAEDARTSRDPMLAANEQNFDRLEAELARASSA